VTDPTRFHVYPLYDAEDAEHEQENRSKPQVFAREDACWLCQQGLCTQILVDENLVVHGLLPT